MVQDINIVVLGGCGFLGQHIIAEILNEKNRKVKEDGNEGNKKENITWNFKTIKVLDIKPFSQGLLTGQKEDAKEVNYQICDVTDLADLTEKLKGATSVINCTAVTPNFRRNDLGCGNHMNKVNMEGVRNIVKACQKNGIQALVHTSTCAVKMGGKRMIEHTETLTPEVSDDDLIFGQYARDRLKAEKIVLDAHGSKCENGQTLRSLALRPPLIYGEGDTNFVPVMYKLGKISGNRLPSMGSPAAFTQAAYAGNIAVAHIRAIQHLLTDEGRSALHSCGGLPVYVTDDSPPNNIGDLALSFLGHTNIEPSVKESYVSTSLKLYLADIVGSIKSIMGMGTSDEVQNMKVTWPIHKAASTITVLSRMRAELCLNYSPVYTWDEALKLSSVYYSKFH